MKLGALATLALLLGSVQADGHPLDSLSKDEIREAVRVVRSAGAATPTTSFAMIKLAPPAKAAVWSWSGGPGPPRQAMLVMRTAGEVSEALVDLRAGRLVGVHPRPNVQTAITPVEWDRASGLVKADRRWQAAMRARGIGDFRAVFCDALSVGSFAANERRRLVKVPCYDARGTSNVYGRPIEGVMALVDLGAATVVEVGDSGLVPISSADPSLEQERQQRLQPVSRPVVSAAPAGSNLTLDGRVARWQAWSFHIGFDQRVGPLISTVRYRDGERERPVLYQGHVAEMFVPYMDGDPNWAFRSYMDVGEYGFGSLASKLVAGVDCPAGATMLSATLAGPSGEPYLARDVMCAFERNTTVPLWRRYEIVTGAHEARQDVELVLRTIPTVGNYDYVYDWVFSRKGEIKIEVGATGILAAKGVAAGSAADLPGSTRATLIAPQLVAPDHDHFLSFRLDLDIDGPANRFVSETLVQETLPRASRRRSLWRRRQAVQRVEFNARPSHSPQIWRVENGSAKTRLGYFASFEIAPDHVASSLLGSDDWPQRRAAFSAWPLSVTAYKHSETYSAGDYPNQSRGDQGLGRYVDRESIDGRDLVAWYTMGFHHVTRPEDWPVLPTVQHKLVLRPHRFFDRNPALNLPREVDGPRPTASLAGVADAKGKAGKAGLEIDSGNAAGLAPDGVQ